MSRHQLARLVDLPLPIESIQQSDEDVLDGVGKVVEPGTVIAGEPRRWDVEISSQVDSYRAVQHTPPRLDMTVLLRVVVPDPLQRLMNGIRIGKDVKRGFPISM